MEGNPGEGSFFIFFFSARLCPWFYPWHLFSYLNSWERASILPFECSVLNKGTTGTILLTFWYDGVLDGGLNPGAPALEASTIPLGYRGGGKVREVIIADIYGIIYVTLLFFMIQAQYLDAVTTVTILTPWQTPVYKIFRADVQIHVHLKQVT